MSDDGHDDYVHAFEVPTRDEAVVAAAALEAAGIPVIVIQEDKIYASGSAQLWVPPDREAEARTLFEDLGQGELETEPTDD